MQSLPAFDLDQIARPTSKISCRERQKNHPRFGPLLAQAQQPHAAMLDSNMAAQFEAQVVRFGERLALQDDESTLTYAQLDGAANQVAHAFRAQSGQGTVAIVMQKSCAPVIAILGAWKAGRAVLLMDLVATQLENLARLSTPIDPSVLVCGDQAQWIRAHLPPGFGAVVLEEFMQDQPATPLAPPDVTAIDPDSPAQVTLTSGSTGVPKVVLRSHRRLLQSLWRVMWEDGLAPGDRHIIFHSLSATPAMAALSAATMTGGSAHLYTGQQAGARTLVEWLAAREISYARIPSRMVREILGAMERPHQLPHLRLLRAGGQAVQWDEAAQFQRFFPDGAVLMCAYAMTEAGVIGAYLVDHTTPVAQERDHSPTIPAGYPVMGVELQIVDGLGQLLPVGETGEIAVRSLFPPDWSNLGKNLEAVAGSESATLAPLYRTNDLGYLRADGCLVHLGRKDDIVKVRGYRVSILEAEAAIRRVAGVADAAVRAFATRDGDNRLVGYVVAQSGTENPLDASALRAALAQNVAPYVIPARFILLDALPLLPSGKVDRKALPRPDSPRPELATPYRAPQTELEQRLCALWAGHLELDQVGVEDNFFELGGDSILMMGLLLTVEKEWQQKVSPAFLLSPTVANLAHFLQSEQFDPQDAERVHMGREIPVRSESWAERREIKQARRRKYGARLLAADRARQEDDDIEDDADTETPADEKGRGAVPGKVGGQMSSTLFSGDLRTRLTRRFYEQGPTIRNRILPYGVGVQFQKQLAKLSSTRRYYRQQLDTLHAWHAIFQDSTPLEEVTQTHLMGMIWRKWRAHALLGNPRAFGRWVRFEGQEALDAIENARQGVILVGTHSTLRNFSSEIAYALDRPRISINTGASASAQERSTINHPRRMARRAQQLMQAHELLRRNGLVNIVGDGRTGTGGVETRLGDRLVQIRNGAAELATATGAIVVPAFAQLFPTGKIVIHLEMPIEPGGPDAADARQITARYAELFSRCWSRYYATMSPIYLSHFFNSPRFE